MAMKVSLCGPHSLETSTLAPVDAVALTAENASGPFWEMYVNLSHQVGSCCVSPAKAEEASASASSKARICMTASEKGGVPIHPRACSHQAPGARSATLNQRRRSASRSTMRRPDHVVLATFSIHTTPCVSGHP